MTTPFALRAIDGANPLGFLAALGTLRLASLRWPESDVTLSWEPAGRFVPRLMGVPEVGEEALCAALLEAPSAPVSEFSSYLGKNITVPPCKFRDFAVAARKSALKADRRLADFSAAFGCEACVDERNDRIRYTQLCFITGSGHQDFLATMTALEKEVTADHIYEALFGGWHARDKGFAFRWDPLDAREYALRWGDPSKEGAWGTWGANRLALEALPFFPAHPRSPELLTTGFRSQRQKGEGRRDEFTWPIWTDPLGCDEIRSLVALSDIQDEAPDRERMRAVGVREVFRATRVRIGQGANYKVSFRPPRSV